ncbi:hypothetical protein C8T65DRAFT_741322 [Cerioporus squamosus]|nr:hypothetical protein C8T65DRAFT_741322 [Cerioporus squamosus]
MDLNQSKGAVMRFSTVNSDLLGYSYLIGDEDLLAYVTRYLTLCLQTERDRLGGNAQEWSLFDSDLPRIKSRQPGSVFAKANSEPKVLTESHCMMQEQIVIWKRENEDLLKHDQNPYIRFSVLSSPGEVKLFARCFCRMDVKVAVLWAKIVTANQKLGKLREVPRRRGYLEERVQQITKAREASCMNV